MSALSLTVGSIKKMTAVKCSCYVVCAEVREVFAKVVSDLRIPYTRVPVEPGLYSCPWMPAHLHKFYKQVEKDALDAIPVFRRHGIRSVCMKLLGLDQASN